MEQQYETYFRQQVVGNVARTPLHGHTNSLSCVDVDMCYEKQMVAAGYRTFNTFTAIAGVEPGMLSTLQINCRSICAVTFTSLTAACRTHVEMAFPCKLFPLLCNAAKLAKLK